MIWRLLCLFFIVLSLPACETVGNQVTTFMGGEDNAIPPTPLKEYPHKLDIVKLWDEDIGDGTDEKYLKLAPVFYQGNIFVADSDGEIKALDTTNGKEIWQTEIDKTISGGPGVGDDLVIVGTSEAEVVALSHDNGKTLWTTRVSSEVLAAPSTANGVVTVRSIDGKIFGLNAESGERLWIYDRDVPTLSLRGTSSPVIAEGLVIAGFDEGRLVAIELRTGKLIWETRIALGSGRSELDRMVDIDSEPVIYDDVVYVATFQGRIAAISLDSGRIVWTRDIPSYAGITVDESAVYITDDDSNVWSLDRFNGNSIWKQEDLQSRALTGPVKTNNTIVVGDLEGYLHWLNSSDGEIIGREKLSGSSIIASPLVVENTVYSYASDGTLGAYTQSGNTDYAETVIKEEKAETAGTPENEITSIDEQQDVETASQENSANEEKSFFGRLKDYITGEDYEPDEEF